MHPSVHQLVTHFQMESHPEGGYYKEVYRSKGVLALQSETGLISRHYCTSIYFLLPGNTFSAFHRIKSDELWHFYAGDPIEIFVLNKDKKLEVILLGNRPERGEVFQAVVEGGCWFASRTSNQEGYGLAGCTVSPGFDFEDFEMAERAQLLQEFPGYETIIQELTRS